MKRLILTLCLLASLCLFSYANGGGRTYGPFRLTVEEEDGSPSGKVKKVKVSNGTLSITGKEATLTTGGGGGAGGSGAGATTFQGNDGTNAVAGEIGEASGIFVLGSQGLVFTGSGDSLFCSANDVHAQVSAYVIDQVSGVSGDLTARTSRGAFTGATAFGVASQTSAYVVAQITGVSNVFAPDTKGCVFADAQSGQSVVVVSDATFALSGASLISLSGNATAGVSIYRGANKGVPLNTLSPDEKIVDIGGGGANIYHLSASGTTVIQAGDILLFNLVDLSTTGASNWTVQIFGRRQ